MSRQGWSFFREALGFRPGFTYAVFSLFSLANIFLVWRIALRYQASAREAFYAAAFMACSASMLIFSRHLVPYDLSLTFWLGAVAVCAGDRPSPLRFALCGMLCVFSFLTYNGYWLLLPVLCVMLALHSSWTLGALAVRAVSMAAGSLLGLSPLLLTGRTLASVVSEYKGFSKTITMGDYADGWTYPLEYLWHCEGLVLVFHLACAALLTAWVLRRLEKGRGRTYLVGLLLTYFILGASSAVLHAFVVYGRTARVLVPFLCLASACVVVRSVGVSEKNRPWRMAFGGRAAGPYGVQFHWTCDHGVQGSF